jgi:hypothetical protein
MAWLRWTIALTCLLAGCASVKVVRVDPSKVDAAYNDPQKAETSGVLFYRPRPYLMVTEAPPPKDQPPPGGTSTSRLDMNNQDKAAQPAAQQLSVQIVWLPDYNQEFEIQAHPGLGSVTMNPTLKDGWNLAGLSATMDSKTAELITAATGLAKAFPLAAMKAGEQKPYCPGLYPINADRSTGLITGVAAPVIVFGDRNQCTPLK